MKSNVEEAKRKMETMTDAEVLATFMETHKTALIEGGARSKGGWWVRKVLSVAASAYEYTTGPWFPAMDAWNECTKLGKCHEVEARLTDRQWWEYIDRLCGQRSLQTMVLRQQFDYADAKSLISADATTKIAALASVLCSANRFLCGGSVEGKSSSE